MFKKLNLNFIIIVSLLISILTIFTFLSEDTYAENPKIKIVAGITPLKTFVDKIAGEKVETLVMIPPGYSPANYAPSPSELEKLSDAEYYFTFQMPAEKSNILSKLNNFNKDLELIKIDKITSEKYEPRKFSDGGIDPHIWMSPKRVKYIIEIITDKLIDLDPKNKDYYQKRSKKYLTKLDEMDKYINEKLYDLKGKSILIYHPVLGYFTEEYGLELKAIEKNGKEATPKRLQELIDFAKNENIKTIFHQSTIDSKQTEVIASEIDGKTVEINPLAENYIENMQRIADLIVNSYK
ncbi:MAG: metal ABC transporter solute-binding protein, Zn/Mn family [Bacillota bacterium]